MIKSAVEIKFPLKSGRFCPPAKRKKRLGDITESVNLADGIRRFRKNKLGMASFIVVLFMMFFAFVLPYFYPYNYYEQIRGSESLAPLSIQNRKAIMAEGGKVFPTFWYRYFGATLWPVS